MFVQVIGHNLGVDAPFAPALTLHEHGGRCWLTLDGITYGAGPTLQDASNDLLVRLFDLAMGVRRGYPVSGETGRSDPRVAAYLWELGEIAVRGGDLRSRVFGGS